MPENASDPKDVADMLESMAKRLRGEQAAARASAGPLAVDAAPELLGTGPMLGALDMFRDDEAITVTVETHNADARQVHVSLLEGKLRINLGGGPQGTRDLPLPAAVNEDAAVATFRNGVLDVVLPLKR